MEPSPTAQPKTTPTESDLQQAREAVAAVTALEACPGWLWLRERIEFRRNDLQNRVLRDEIITEELRGKVRFAARALELALQDIETGMQAALRLLHRVGQLDDHKLIERIVKPDTPKPPPIEDPFNPFAQEMADLNHLFPKPTPAPTPETTSPPPP